MNEWVWSNGGMILTGENWSIWRGTLYSVCGRWMNMEQWWNHTDRGKSKYIFGEKPDPLPLYPHGYQECLSKEVSTYIPLLKEMDCEKSSQKFQAAVAVWDLRFSDVTQGRLVVSDRRFGTTYRSHLQGSGSPKGLTHKDGTDRLSWNVGN
jgi:hypothetical protein